MRRFIVGTRGSALALWQTRHVIGLLKTTHSDIEERVITTQGDTHLAERLVGRLEKGFFTQEIEAALHAHEIDWAVHSLKDLPTRSPKGLTLGAILPRSAASDLLLLNSEWVDVCQPLGARAGARIGTSSLRREALLAHHAPLLRALPLRGNVPTRIAKLREGLYDGIVLAEAGVARLQLSLDGLAVFRLNPRRWPGAPGQGAIAVECREDDEEVKALLARIHHAPTAAETSLERDFLRILEGGCTTPFGCFVEESLVSLGLAHDTGFRFLHVPLPSRLTAPWVEDTLQKLTSNPSQEEYSDEWLVQQL